MLEIIQAAYELIESLNISFSTLLAAAIALVFIALFATREALSWFLKLDSLKKDVRSLRANMQSLEAEIRSLQELLKEQKASDELPPPANIAKLAGRESFPINH